MTGSAFIRSVDRNSCRDRRSRTWSRGGALVLAFVLAICVTGEGTAAAQQVNHAGGSAVSGDPDTGALPGLWSMMMLAAGFATTWLFLASRWYRLRNAPRRPEPCSPTMAVALAASMIVMTWVGAALGQGVLVPHLLPEDPEALPRQSLIALGAYAGQAVILLFYIRLVLSHESGRADGRPSSMTALLLGAAALLLFWPITNLVVMIASLLMRLLGAEPPDAIAHDTLLLFAQSDRDGWLLLMAFLVVIAAPVLEEVMYRGIIQGALVQVGFARWHAILLASIVFTLMHAAVVQPHALTALFVLSIGFGWIYEKTGRLAAPIAMHVLFNALNLSLALLGSPAPAA